MMEKYKLPLMGILLFGIALGKTAIAQTAEAPVYKVGDKITYSLENIGDRKEPYIFTNQVYKIDANSAWIYGLTQENNPRNTPQFVWRYDLKRNNLMERFRLDINGIGTRTGNRQKDDDWYQYPLSVGKTWKRNSVTDNGENKCEAKVENFEKVKVKAGEYDAFNIKYECTYSGRFNNGSSGTNRWEQNEWFSPSVGRMIKSVNKTYTSGSGRLWDHTVTEMVRWEPEAPLKEIPEILMK